MAIKKLPRRNWREDWHPLQDYPSLERQIVQGKTRFRYKGKPDGPIYDSNPLQKGRSRSSTDPEIARSNARTRLKEREDRLENIRSTAASNNVPEGVPRLDAPLYSDEEVRRLQKAGIRNPTGAALERGGRGSSLSDIALSSLPTPVKDPELHKDVARNKAPVSEYNEYAYPSGGVPRTAKSTVKSRESKGSASQNNKVIGRTKDAPVFDYTSGELGMGLDMLPSTGPRKGEEVKGKKALELMKNSNIGALRDLRYPMAAVGAGADLLSDYVIEPLAQHGPTVLRNVATKGVIDSILDAGKDSLQVVDAAIGSAGLGIQPVVDGSERGSLTPKLGTAGKEGSAGAAGSVGTGGTVGKSPSGTPEEDEADKVPVPSYIWKDMSEEYWSTAENPQPEELSIFQSQGFQESAMVFGLSLLMGDSIEDALQYAGRSYARSSYKQTEQYKDFHKMGIPDQVIMNALETDDWTQLKSWHDTINATAVKIKEAEAKAIAAAGSLSEEQKAGYSTIRKQFEGIQTQLTNANNAIVNIGSFKGRKLNGAEGIQLIFDYFRLLDGNTAVKTEDIRLLMDRLPLTVEVKQYLGRINPTSSEGLRALDPAVTNALIESMMATAERQQYNSYQGFKAIDAQADQLKLSASARLWAPALQASQQWTPLFYNIPK